MISSKPLKLPKLFFQSKQKISSNVCGQALVQFQQQFRMCDNFKT